MSKIDDYELLELIGKGGFGEVYRARQLSINREVAVKMIPAEYAAQPEWVERFQAEAQLVGKLEHPYIVPLYDYWHDNGGAYLVMRWMRGGNLRQRIRDYPPQTDEIRRWVEQLAQALRTAHQAGVVHRDLKPENVLLDEEGNAYLADFGIAKSIVSTQSLQSETPMTPSYAAPEQFSGEPLTPATDIYSLGIMLYEMLTGRPPFEGTMMELMFAHLQRDLPSVQVQQTALPQSVDDVLARATAKAPEDRFMTSTALWDQFCTALDGKATQPIPAPAQAGTNPFFHRGPIRDRAYFFGRERETRQIMSLLQNGQSVSIIGQRRIGKTSLLYHIADDARPQDDYLLVFLDCGAFVTLPEPQIYRTVLEEIDFEMEQRSLSIAFQSLESDKPVTYRSFERDLRRLFKVQPRLVLMLDEFELLSRNEHLRSEFFTGLRALAMRHPITYITGTRQPLIELTYADSSTLSSPFFNIFATIRLGLFTDEEAAALLEALSGFDDNLIEWLYQLAGGHPLFTQIAGYHAFEVLRERGEADLGVIRQRVRDEVLPHLEYYWRSLTANEQRLLAMLPATTDRERLREFEHACLIWQDADGNYRYFSPLLAWFIQQQAVPGITQAGALRIDENRRQVVFDDVLLDVTPTQYALLCALVANADEVQTTAALEAAIWGDEYVDDPERLKSVVKGLRRALGDHADHLDNERGVGYCWRTHL